MYQAATEQNEAILHRIIGNKKRYGQMPYRFSL